MKHDQHVIEGEFTVVGEEPPPQPVILNWPGLWMFIASFPLAGLIKWVIMRLT